MNVWLLKNWSLKGSNKHVIQTYKTHKFMISSLKGWLLNRNVSCFALHIAAKTPQDIEEMTHTAASRPHSHNHESLLDVSNVKDVSAKWERSNMSADIYYMCWNQMEATHSSQQRVTEVTPVPHKKQLPLPSMGTGLDWCLQRPTQRWSGRTFALIIPTLLHLVFTDRGYF